MKTLQWLRNSKGEFEQVGALPEKVKWVYIEFLDPAGIWQRVGRTERKAREAFDIVVSAIQKKQTGKWYGYRLVEVEGVERKSKKSKEEPSKAYLDWAQGQIERPIQDELNRRKEMAKKTKKVEAAPKAEKILGYFRKGTAMAAFIEPLLDEKSHKLSVLFDKAKKAGADPEFRLTVFRQKCKELNLAGVMVDRDADTIQIKIGKGQPVPGSTKKVVTRAPVAAKKANGSAAPDKDLSDVAKWVRQTLKSGDDWTKNKVVEKVHTDHGAEPKRIQAAIASEIKAKGIVEEKGLLSLTN